VRRFIGPRGLLTAALVLIAAPLVPAQQPMETAIPDKVRLFIPFKDYSAEDNKRILDMYSWLRVADVAAVPRQHHPRALHQGDGAEPVGEGGQIAAQ